MDDWELLERYRSGRCQQAFAELVARHAGLVYGVCRRRARDAHLAEDLAQAVFLLLARRPPRRRGNAALAGWLYQTAVYACMNAIRAQRIRDRHERHAAEQRRAASAAALNDSAPRTMELSEEMERALSRLPRADRDALLLRYYQGMTVGAVGQALGITEDTAAKRLSRAIDRLRRALTSTSTSRAAGVHSMAAPLSAVALGEAITQLTQSPAPAAVQAQLASVASGGGAASASLVVEQIVDGVVRMMYLGQLKLLASVGALLLVVAGGVVTTSVIRADRRARDTSIARATTAAQQRQVSTSERNRANELVARGWALWRQQRYAEAGDLFTQALEIDPGQSDGWNGLGWSRFNTGESDSARVAFERCLAVAPGHAAATNGLGQIAYQDGDFVQAERHFLRAADAAPAAAYSLGRMYLVQQRWDEAERWLDRAFSSDGALRSDEHQRMLAAAKARRLDDELRATIAPRPPGPAMREIQRARQLAREGRADEARAAFDDALALGPEDPEVLSAVGWHLLDGGERDAARELFDRALKVQPRYPPAANGLAKLRESASR